MIRDLVVVCAVMFMAQNGGAADLVLRSGEAQTGLLELYTSEGCSSCPPADRWLSNLKGHEGLWVKFVPLGLHVDYWDYIGWKDRFAKPAFGHRQRQYARQDSVATVYTPGFIYNGREWRSWFGRPSTRFPDGGKPGVLALAITGDKADVEFLPTSAQDEKFDVSIALLGFGISTAVKAGENSGRQLNHDFVVLGMEHNQLRRSDGKHGAMVALPALANDRKHGVGLGFTVGTLEPDGSMDIDTKSFTIFGKGGFKDNWSINGTLHIGEDDDEILFGAGIDVTQLSVGVGYNFLQDNVFRPFVQAGLGNVDVDESGGIKEDDTGLMVGFRLNF